MRALSPADCRRLFVFATLALGAELVGSCCLSFAPGWANGWPGLTIYQVWSTWLAVTLFVMLVTVGVGVGSVVSLILCIFPRARRHTGNVLVIWTVIWAILSALTGAWTFREIYASTLEMWPNGYPG
jgi:hypothetical protein